MAEPRTVTESTELLTYLFAAWPQTKKKQVRTWLKFQSVMVNGRPVSQFNHLLHPGDVVAIRSDRYAIPKTVLTSRMKVYFEDESLIVIDKPENLLSVASEGEQERTAEYQLGEYMRQRKPNDPDRIWVVHRLDRETSGLMVFAKSSQAASVLQQGWEDVEKRYEAVVEGHLPNDSGTFECDLDETSPFKVYVAVPSERTRHAVTHYRVIKRSKSRTLVSLTLVTGRRHQIRVHLANAGCPIVGDEKYGAKTDPANRLGLHSWSLSFPHPKTHEPLRFESPLPKDLVKLV